MTPVQYRVGGWGVDKRDELAICAQREAGPIVIQVPSRKA